MNCCYFRFYWKSLIYLNGCCLSYYWKILRLNRTMSCYCRSFCFSF